MNNSERYAKVFCDTFNFPEERFDVNFTFNDTEEWDSVIHMALITRLEDEFSIILDTEDILNYHSFINGKRILEKYGISFE